jgi:hypothetical protein
MIVLSGLNPILTLRWYAQMTLRHRHDKRGCPEICDTNIDRLTSQDEIMSKKVTLHIYSVAVFTLTLPFNSPSGAELQKTYFDVATQFLRAF